MEELISINGLISIYGIPIALSKLFYKLYITSPISNFELKLSIYYLIILASRASGCHLDTQYFKNHPSGHPNLSLCNLLKCQFQTYNSNEIV